MSFFKLLETNPVEAAQQASAWFEKFMAELGADAKTWLPIMTGAASAVEAVTGNAALIPVTKAAGAGAEQIATLAAAHGNIADVVTTSLELAKSAAEANGSTDAVNSITQAQNTISGALNQAAPVISALQTIVAGSAS